MTLFIVYTVVYYDLQTRAPQFHTLTERFDMEQWKLMYTKVLSIEHCDNSKNHKPNVHNMHRFSCKCVLIEVPKNSEVENKQKYNLGINYSKSFALDV